MYAVENRIVNIDEMDFQLKNENKLRSIKADQLDSLQCYDNLYSKSPPKDGDDNFMVKNKEIYIE